MFIAPSLSDMVRTTDNKRRYRGLTGRTAFEPVNWMDAQQEVNQYDQSMREEEERRKRMLGGDPRAMGMKRGGPVPGKGTGDKVHALLEPGEFVVRRQAVKKLGLDKMEAINEADKKQTGGLIFDRAKRRLGNLGRTDSLADGKDSQGNPVFKDPKTGQNILGLKDQRAFQNYNKALGGKTLMPDMTSPSFAGYRGHGGGVGADDGRRVDMRPRGARTASDYFAENSNLRDFHAENQTDPLTGMSVKPGAYEMEQKRAELARNGEWDALARLNSHSRAQASGDPDAIGAARDSIGNFRAIRQAKIQYGRPAAPSGQPPVGNDPRARAFASGGNGQTYVDQRRAAAFGESGGGFSPERQLANPTGLDTGNMSGQPDPDFGSINRVSSPYGRGYSILRRR